MHHYGLTDLDVLAMPMRRFWFLNYQVDRLLAQNDLRSLSVVSAAQSSEGYKNLHERLVGDLGKTITVDPIKAAQSIDTSAGIAELAALSQLKTVG